MFIGLRKQHTNFDNCVWLTDVSHSFLARYFPIVLPLWNESPVGYLKPVAIVIMRVAKYSMTLQLKRSYSWFYHRRSSKHSWHCNLIRGYFSFLSQCWANALSIQVMSQLLCPLFTLLASALGKGRERKKYLKMFLKQSQQNFGALLHHENASICKSCGCILHGRRTAVTRATLNKHTSY